ncbi:hypothetical protein MPDQ_005320 [Monascus purpureus]|uniref:Uncharacterized protein n=1 Tax=Monascus purpureus TaxID=5098 RepID=A0A507QZ20_MONPU|nr:hypothetical protein MPDQ_005320 [Monascus purpureus]BDD58073.1 hypothetical protein MAP00_003380 [Monascus purpureus]
MAQVASRHLPVQANYLQLILHNLFSILFRPGSPSAQYHVGHLYCEKDTEPHQASDLGENPCSRAIDAPEQAKDASTAKGKSATPGPSTQSTECSSPEHFGAQTTPTSDSPVRYPSIAVVVPPPP